MFRVRCVLSPFFSSGSDSDCKVVLVFVCERKTVGCRVFFAVLLFFLCVGFFCGLCCVCLDWRVVFVALDGRKI